MKNNNDKIQEIINSIKDTNNFRIAFTHKSVRSLYPNKELQTYERLEFFGDSLLAYYATYFLFKCFPQHSEGDLTKLRTLLVERKNLSKISLNIGLDKYLNLSSALKLEPESDKTIKILADIFESFIAALYIEKGENVLHTFLSLTLFNRPETLKYLNNYKLNSLFINKNPINFISDNNNNMLEQVNKLDSFDINTELRNTNKILCELNSNILNVNKELSDLRLGGLKNINNNNSIILILLLILAIIVIKLIL